jgi:uncharacterized protein (DUF433 family)
MISPRWPGPNNLVARCKVAFQIRSGVLNMPSDWSGCPSVREGPGYLSGKLALRDDPRVPPEFIVENMDAGETPEQVIENFGLRTPLRDVLAVYDHAKRQRVKSPV